MCSLDILIAGKYRLGRKLGGGSFGEIFLGTNLQTGEEVGIKLVSQQRWGGVLCCALLHQFFLHPGLLTQTLLS